MASPKKKRRYIAPLDIIPYRPDDEPLICLQINAFWVSFLLFAVDTGRYPESWLGTLEENKQARGDVNRLIDMLVLAEDCAMVSNCCVVPLVLHRTNPNTLQEEISTDNGQTWTQDPEAAIINPAVTLPPPVTAGVSGTKCDAASNGKGHIEDLIVKVSENLQTALTVFELAVAVAGVILEIALIIITGGAGAPAALQIAAIIWAAASAVFNMGKVAFDDYWTNDQRDKILCSLYCAIGEDGSFTPAGYASFLDHWERIATPSPAFNLVLQEVKAVGLDGLNNLCAYGNTANADCSACECVQCHGTWNFTQRTNYLGTTIVAGTWEGGKGIKDTARSAFNIWYAQVVIVFDQPCGATHLHVETEYNAENPAWVGSVTFEKSVARDEQGQLIWDNIGATQFLSGIVVQSAVFRQPNTAEALAVRMTLAGNQNDSVPLAWLRKFTLDDTA